jgi:hypothetical protein
MEQRSDSRRPLKHLEALLATPTYADATTLFTQIRIFVEAAEVESWMRAVVTLWQRERLDENEAAYLIDMFAEEVLQAADRDPDLVALGRRFDEIERAHGLNEDEGFPVGKGPPEWHALHDRWAARVEELKLETIRRSGAERFADQRGRAPAEWESRTELGRDTFWGRWDRGAEQWDLV